MRWSDAKLPTVLDRQLTLGVSCYAWERQLSVFPLTRQDYLRVKFFPFVKILAGNVLIRICWGGGNYHIFSFN